MKRRMSEVCTLTAWCGHSSWQQKQRMQRLSSTRGSGASVIALPGQERAHMPQRTHFCASNRGRGSATAFISRPITGVVENSLMSRAARGYT